MAAICGRCIADIGQFEQVVVNLAVNARDAMPDGGELTIRTRNVTAEEIRGSSPIANWSPADYVLVEIEDTGTGIAPERDREDLRAFLHHQGSRQGHGARPVDGLRHHQADRRLHLLRFRGRQGHDVPDIPAPPCGQRAAGRSCLG